MKKLNMKTEIMIWMIILLPLLMYFILRDQLPALVTSHYNSSGEANDTMTPLNFALVMTGVDIFVYLVILFAPYFDPKKRADENYGRYHTVIRILVPVFNALIVGYEYIHAMGYTGANNRLFVTMLVLFVFLVLGNYMNSMRPNWIIGFRTPWTLSNDEVWKRTHRLGSKLMFGSAMAGLFLLLFIPTSWMNVLLMCVVFISAVVPLVYSFIIFKQLENK